MPICLIAVVLTWMSQGCLPGFCAAKLVFFPFVINKYLGWGAVSGDYVVHDPPASAPSCSIRELILFAPVFTVAFC